MKNKTIKVLYMCVTVTLEKYHEIVHHPDCVQWHRHACQKRYLKLCGIEVDWETPNRPYARKSREENNALTRSIKNFLSLPVRLLHDKPVIKLRNFTW